MNDDTLDLLNPLSPDDLDKLRAGLERITLMRKALVKAKRAGIDVTTLEQQNLANEEAIKKLLNVYGSL